jgi:hypothetical protein
MKKFRSVLSTIFGIVCAFGFFICISVNVDHPGWLKYLMIGFITFVVSFFLASFFNNPNTYIRHIYASFMTIATKIQIRRRPNSKLAVGVRAKFSSRYGGRYNKKINYKKLYRYALRYYDRDHFQEV